jgi:hypothetical protein
MARKVTATNQEASTQKRTQQHYQYIENNHQNESQPFHSQ